MKKIENQRYSRSFKAIITQNGTIASQDSLKNCFSLLFFFKFMSWLKIKKRNRNEKFDKIQIQRYSRSFKAIMAQTRTLSSQDTLKNFFFLLGDLLIKCPEPKKKRSEMRVNLWRKLKFNVIQGLSKLKSPVIHRKHIKNEWNDKYACLKN